MLIGIQLQLFSLFLNSASFLLTNNIVYKVLTGCLSYPARTMEVNMKNTKPVKKTVYVYTEQKTRRGMKTKFL